MFHGIVSDYYLEITHSYIVLLISAQLNEHFLFMRVYISIYTQIL